MTSFEPESCGLLIDNMQYRRLCLDQIYQMQLQFLRNQLGQQHQQLIDSSSQLITQQQQQPQNIDSTNSNNNNNKSNLNTTEQQLQQVCVPAAQTTTSTLIQHQQPTLSLANFNMTTSSASMKRYSLILNPSVHLMGLEAASIAYTRLDHFINIQTLRLQIESTQETRIWHLKFMPTDNNQQWQCIHLHSSRQQTPSQTTANLAIDSGPQLNQSLLRHMNNQQLNALTLAMQQDLLKDKQNHLAAAAAPINKNVPIISLNHSSHGSGSQTNQTSASTSAAGASSSNSTSTTAPR